MWQTDYNQQKHQDSDLFDDYNEHEHYGDEPEGTVGRSSTSAAASVAHGKVLQQRESSKVLVFRLGARHFPTNT